MSALKRHFFVWLAVLSIVLNCVLSVSLYQRSRISVEDSSAYLAFLAELQVAMQSSDRAVKDSGQQLRYDVNEQNQYVSDSANLLHGMEAEMMRHGINVRHVVNALGISYIPNLRMPDIVKGSHFTIGEVFSALHGTTYTDVGAAQLRQRIISLSHTLASQRF